MAVEGGALHTPYHHALATASITGDTAPQRRAAVKKTFQLTAEGRHRDRVLDAVKHEIRKYLKRERRRALPEGVDYWDFDCRFGLSEAAAEVVHLGAVIGLVDAAAREQAASFYLEILAKHGHRQPRPAETPQLP